MPLHRENSGSGRKPVAFAFGKQMVPVKKHVRLFPETCTSFHKNMYMFFQERRPANEEL